MNTRTSVDQREGRPDTTGVARIGLLKVAIFIVILAAILFVSSGRLTWVMAWIYIGMVVASSGIGALLMSPELLAERAQLIEGAKKWDILLAVLMARVGPTVTLILAGLDARYAWSSQIPLGLQVAALAIGVLGLGLTIWAVASNEFFSGLVRIQKDRGHSVVCAGPYRYVRHPGYVGGIVFQLATPIMLNSQWALIPAGLASVVIIVRSALEDRTLQGELDGYQEYAQRVRYRLLPGIW